MMKLEVTVRDAKTGLDKVRAGGMIPAVVYGDDETVVISIPRSGFITLFKEVGESALFELTGLPNEDKIVLVKDIQRHPVSEEILHIDLYATTKGEAIEATVPLEFVGASEAEKAGAHVIKVMREITVESLPQNLPHEIVVDMTLVNVTGDTITVADLQVPEGVTLLADMHDAVVTSSEAQEIVEEEVEEIDMSAIESEQKGKGEDEGSEGSEGAKPEGDSE